MNLIFYYIIIGLCLIIFDTIWAMTRTKTFTEIPLDEKDFLTYSILLIFWPVFISLLLIKLVCELKEQ